MRIITKSVEETIGVGRWAGMLAKAGCCICLDGDLGSGKTHLTKGIALGLGVDEAITSPTFTIVQEYESHLPLFHFDWYRLEDEEELFAMGFSDYLRRDGVMVIEWAEHIASALPSDRLHIRLSYGEKENERILSMESFGKTSSKLLQGLKAKLEG